MSVVQQDLLEEHMQRSVQILGKCSAQRPNNAIYDSQATRGESVMGREPVTRS